MTAPRRLLVLAVVAAIAAAACGGDDAPEVATEGSAVEQDGGGATITLTPGDDASPEDLERAAEIIGQRLDALDAGTASVAVRDGVIEVVLPDQTDPELVTDVVARTAELTFRPVETVLATDVVPDCDPAGVDGAPDPLFPQFDGDGEAPTLCYGLGQSALGAGSVATAAAEMDGLGSWTVTLELTDGPGGLDGFNDVAAVCFGRAESCPSGQLAIVLDDVVISAPSVQQPSFDASGVVITGDFSEQEAKDLALVLRFGALPVPLEVTDITEPG